MNHDELTPFEKWASRYALTFGISYADLPTILAWDESLAASPDELHEATRWLAKNPATFATSKAGVGGKMVLHLDCLQTALRTIRKAKAQDEQATHRDENTLEPAEFKSLWRKLREQWNNFGRIPAKENHAKNQDQNRVAADFRSRVSGAN